jgi:two-component system sensor histidine kinase TtrS
MISQSRTPAGILRTLTAILCLAAILMSVTGSSAWAAPRVVRVVGIQDGISDSQADYFRRTIAELNDLTEDRIFVTRPIPAASSLDLNAYQGLDFAIVSPRVFALLERYNGFIPMASLSVDIPDCEPGAELRPVVSALVFATPDADEDGLAKPHLSDIAGETVTVVKGDEVDTTFLLQNELSSRRLAPVKVRVASDGGTPSEIIRRAVERGDKLFAVSTDLLRETSSDLFSGFVKVDMRVDDETGLVSSVTPMPGRVFAAGLSVARMGLLEFAATLFALDIAPDIHWVRPADYRSVHLAAERMRDPVYMSYQKKTLLEEMREHAAWVILAAAILIGMIWHSVAAERLVRRRSAELMETVKRQQASERQFEALERMTAVSQMSNIVAHELRQPLANGTLTADSLEFALGRILAENERASDIVEHVRDYARKRRRQITPVDLTQMSAKVVSSMRASNARVSFESEVPAGLFVEGDSLEIELVLRNLVKNAGESAAQADGVPRVVLAGERIGDEVVITVTDNGPVRTKAEIDAFLVPLRSEKSGGLGLGLAIVRRIIEAYGGTIVFDVVEPQGVRVEARLPARPDL